jgi:hypothetical protein
VHFLPGFEGNSGANHGAFVVKSWWNAWQTWSSDGRFARTKKGHVFELFFDGSAKLFSNEVWARH